MEVLVEGHVLSWIVFLPLVSALLLLSTGLVAAYLLGSHGFSPAIWRLFGFGASTIDFAIACFYLWPAFDPAESGFQLVERVPWMPALGIDYVVGVDGIGLVLVMLVTFLVPVVLLASWNRPARSVRSAVFSTLMLETALVGSFVSLNLFQFHLFSELCLLPVFFMIGMWGGFRRKRAAKQFLTIAMLGSLASLAATSVVAAHNLNLNRLLLGAGATWNLDLVQAAGAPGLALLDTEIPFSGAAWWESQTALFAAFALGFATKAALFPLHAFFIGIHREGPTFSSALLAGSGIALGSYALLRFAFPLFPEAATNGFFAPTFTELAIVGAAYLGLIAIVRTDLKEMVATLVCGHAALVVCGLFSLNAHGITGGVIALALQAVCAAALFLLVGFLYERRSTRDVGAFEGLAGVMPAFAACFAIATAAAIGAPFLGPFVGEFLILLGVFAARPVAASLAAFALLLLAAPLLLAQGKILFGSTAQDGDDGLRDLDWRERIAMVLLFVPVIGIGLNPNPLLRRVEPAVIEMLERMERGGAELDIEEPWSPSLIPIFPAPEPAIDDESLLPSGER